MTRGLNLLGAALLVALSVRPSASPVTGAQDASAPKITAVTLETRPLSGTLAREALSLGSRKGGPVWAGYAVAQVDGRRHMCCWDSIKTLESSGGCCGRCSLEANRGVSYTTKDDKKVRLEPGRNLNVLFRTGKDGVTEVRTFSEDCELDAGELPFIWLTGVETDQSLDWLASLVEAGADDELYSHAVAAIALHAGTRADGMLERYARSGVRHGVREQAIFWMGQTRGRAGYEVVSRIAREDRDVEIRKKAIFSLSQSEVPDGVEVLIRFAHDDPRAEIREEALFWLAQMAGQRAVKTLTDVLESDPEIGVKKKAVFALSQLPKDEGIPLLLDVARKHRLPEIRKEAIFWLGQSGDPRALDLIEEMLR